MRVITSDSGLNGIDLLLGGWRDLIDDIQALQKQLAASAQLCPCGRPGAGEQCHSCDMSPNHVRYQCADCFTRLCALADRIGQLEGDTIRHLPTVYSLNPIRTNRVAAHAFEHAVCELVAQIRRLRAAADELCQGGGVAAVDALYACAAAARAASIALDDAIQGLR